MYLILNNIGKYMRINLSVIIYYYVPMVNEPIAISGNFSIIVYIFTFCIFDDARYYDNFELLCRNNL